MRERVKFNRKLNRIEVWVTRIECLTLHFTRPAVANGRAFAMPGGGYVDKKYVRECTEGGFLIRFVPCTVEDRGNSINLSFPIGGEFDHPSDSIGVSMKKRCIRAMRKSGVRRVRVKNPTCNWCRRESDRRLAVKMPDGTTPSEAVYVENSKPYGQACWGCNRCIARVNKDGRMQIFNT